MTGSLGAFGESWTVGYLSRSGYQILDRNVRYRTGEIDIVARDGVTTVFVEVKCRRSSRFGSPEEAITAARYQRLAGAVERYVEEHGMADCPIRIDVVGIEVDRGGRVARHAHIVGAEPPS